MWHAVGWPVHDPRMVFQAACTVSRVTEFADTSGRFSRIDSDAVNSAIALATDCGSLLSPAVDDGYLWADGPVAGGRIAVPSGHRPFGFLRGLVLDE